MPWTLEKPPQNMEDLPEEIKRIGIAAANQAMKDGNTDISAIKIGWGAIKRIYQKNDKGKWVKIIKSKNEMGQPVFFAEPVSKSQFRHRGYDPKTGYIEMQLGFIGENISQEVYNDIVVNFESNARGQVISQCVDHPHFNDDNLNPDKRSYGILQKLMQEGHEIWIGVMLSELGKEVIDTGSYLYLSPGWFPESQHAITGEKVKNVLFEVSFTNMPQEKLMNPIIKLAEDLKFNIVIEDEKPKGDVKIMADKEKRKEEKGNSEPELTEEEKKKKKEAEEKSKKECEKLAEGEGDDEQEGAEEKDFEEIKDLVDNLLEMHKKAGVSLKGKPGVQMAKQKIKEAAEHLKKHIPEEFKSELQTKKAVFQTEEYKQLSKQLAETTQKVKIMEDRERKVDVTKLTESWIPQPGKDRFTMKKESQPGMVNFLMELSPGQIKSFSKLMSELPGEKINITEKGHGMIPAVTFGEPQKISSAQFESEVVKKMRENKDYNKTLDANERIRIMNEIRSTTAKEMKYEIPEIKIG